MKSGVELIAEVGGKISEQLEQMRKEGHSLNNTELSRMAVTYALPNVDYGTGGELSVKFKRTFFWPFHISWFVKRKDRRDELALAGALIAAEIDRLSALTNQVDKTK